MATQRAGPSLPAARNPPFYTPQVEGASILEPTANLLSSRPVPEQSAHLPRHHSEAEIDNMMSTLRRLHTVRQKRLEAKASEAKATPSARDLPPQNPSQPPYRGEVDTDTLKRLKIDVTTLKH